MKTKTISRREFLYGSAASAAMLTMGVGMSVNVFADEAETAYISGAYEIDEALQGPTEYLEPVFYENADGPTIGATYVGVIEQDGLYFRDIDNDGELDPFEDWRLSTEERVADLLSKMTTEQKMGLLFNQLMCTPTAKTADAVYDEDGNIDLSQLMIVTEDALNAYAAVEEEEETEGENEGFAAASAAASAGVADADRANSTGEMITYESRSGVLRGTLDGTVSAMWKNAVNMTAEYAAVAKGEPAIPFTIISNPQSITDEPSTEGFAAAVMGDVANGGDYSLIERWADLDGQIWAAKGINRMYGPQIDLITDPRWNRNNGTYTEDPEIMAGIAAALVNGYQNGEDGAQSGDVALIMKHFPGDGAAYNGFESLNKIGQWRGYKTEGSLVNYQLVGFQAAVDAGVAGIMTGYSMMAEPGTYGSVAQSYRGLEVTSDGMANAYSPTIITKLLRETMGFDGLLNTDSGIVTLGMQFGAEDMTEEERIATIINAGSDVIGDQFYTISWDAVYAAYEDGLLEEEAIERANTNYLKLVFDMGQFDNPYSDPEECAATVESLTAELQEVADEVNQKSVVLMKNSGSVLPLADTSKTVYVESFTSSGADDSAVESWEAAFEAAGYTLAESRDEADILFLDVVPGGVSNSNAFMNVIDLVDGLEVEERNYPTSTEKTGDTVEATTLQDVSKIAKYADAVHENGGIVIASINITNPWILTNLEPYCDGLIGSFTTTVDARMAVLTGEYNPTGKLPITMVSCNEVIAVNDEVGEDGETYEICVSPNDVPGYDKDQYMSEEVLAQSPSGSYAYQDTDGNVYKAWFGLSYE
ncbi:MAG: glycoside hydrolase family 3 C-terminal domain-containing protein [Lachnospiraceae bacterium]|nr:glycoside hydrolase family 3 C-terminal domain-containing protein [Lachnospiraceae bacterium]